MENYDEGQAIAVRTEDVDRVEEERLITYVHIPNIWKACGGTTTAMSKVVHLLSATLSFAESIKLKGYTSSPPPGKDLTSSKRSPDQALIAYVT